MWDVFISHASEDKEKVARPLAEKLAHFGVRVWYDEQALKLGDSLRRKIDQGLSESRFGVVILSHSFFAKPWPQLELDGLVAREQNGNKVVLPIWHDVGHSEIARYSPILAGKLAVSTSLGLDEVINQILLVLEAESNYSPSPPKDADIDEIINLNPHPKSYFWFSEGKREIMVALLRKSHSVLKKSSSNKPSNLNYYLGIYHLQAGQYLRAVRYFNRFLHQIEGNIPIALTARANLGKAYFYLMDYVSASKQWNLFKRDLSMVPSELSDYYMASIIWRECLMNNNPIVRDQFEGSFRDMFVLADKVGVSQMKNLWFSLAYSDLLRGNAQASLKSIERLKSLLRKDLRQPMFMIAALFLEARSLSQLGECEKTKSLTILQSIARSFKVNWDSEIFVNNLIPNLSHNALLERLENRLQPSKRQYISDDLDYYSKDENMLYVRRYLPSNLVIGAE